MDAPKITYFAETDTRNKRTPFGIKSEDRTRHIYVIGKTGMGKSTLLENMAVQDIKNGEGLAFIDPHGKTADLLLDYVPQERIKDVVYFAPFDLEHPISFNVMEDVGHDRRHLVANGLMSAFKKIWVDAWSARMEYILNNILLALLEYPDSTLIGVNRMLSDKDYRKKVVDNITDPAVKSFWLDEFAKYGDRYMQEAGAAIQNKIGQFVSNPLVRNIIGQPKSTFDIRKLMDEKKILIVNLSKGRVGEANANLLGSMLITKIYLAAMSRADVSEQYLKKHLPNFYLYVDEFQSFANESFADILSEARKYKLNLTIAHQYIEQMSEEVRAAVFGNVGTMIIFRVGAFDAEFLEKEVFPTFTKEDLVNLGYIQVYLKLMIDGVTSSPFSATTLPPIEKPLINYKADIIDYSRRTFARPRSEVEEAIKIWHQPILPDGSPKKKLEEAKAETKKAEAMTKFPKPADMRTSESELRKAITINYLKDVPKFDEKPKEKLPEKPIEKPPEPKLERKPQPSKDKGPKPENLSALRNALAAVMKDVPAPQPVPKPQPQSSTPPPPVSPKTTPTPTAPPLLKEEGKNPTSQKKKPQEIPEELLQKILEIES
ncbi:MAG: type IV secretion system DNA-binding domain-containing protein [bacterium]|nr:type IV secretion system DNA-binding domain-containing protein [bacterium]